MKDDTDLRTLLKRNIEVLVAIGVFSTLAIGIQSYVPGILGFFMGSMSIIITMVFFISFLADLIALELNFILKCIFIITLSMIILSIILHLFLGILRKPLTKDFYILLALLFIILEVIILSIILNLSEKINDIIIKNIQHLAC